MSAQGKSRALGSRFAYAAAVGVGLLLATSMEAAAEIVPVQCLRIETGSLLGPVAVLQNTTGRPIPSPSRLTVSICDRSGCRTVIVTALTLRTDGKDPEPYQPGATFAGALFELPPPNGPVTCTATIWMPDDFKEKKTPKVPTYTRTRPPGPPQPGLLEDGPGFSRQTPSSVGTQKPTAPPSPSKAPTLR